MTDEQRYSQISRQLSTILKPSTTPKKSIFVIPSRDIPEPSGHDLAAKLNEHEGIIDVKAIKGLPTIEDIVNQIKEKNLLGVKEPISMNDMRWHGAGGVTSTAVSALFTTDTFISTDQQKVFNSTQNVLFTISLSAGGTTLTPTTDYTTSTSQATLSAGSYPNGLPAGTPVVWVYIRS